MRVYKVFIIAEDQTGNKIEFVELAEYPHAPIDKTGCVKESEREAKAIAQVHQRMPHLKNVQVKWSIHI